MNLLKKLYNQRKRNIKNRLKEFRRIEKDKDIFSELCFCILTPQSKAVNCDRAIKNMNRENLLFNGREDKIRDNLKGLVRFHNKKAKFLIAARNMFMNDAKLDIKNRLDARDTFKTREWLVENVKGLGYKEASHFLRNIGLGKDISILDVHILRNLVKYKVLKEIPPSLTKKNYIEIEGKMRDFAKKNNIPLAELDLLFWSIETGFVFK